MTNTIKTNYFYGNKVSDYGIENGYVDYRTLAKSFDAVLNNDIFSKAWQFGGWEQVNGYVDNSEQIEELQDEIEKFESFIRDYEELQDEIMELDEAYEENAEYLSLSEKIETVKTAIEELEENIQELEEEQNNQKEIFQWFIISDNGAEILQDWTNENVFYHEKLDMYMWGVTHYGTSWDYVLTDIQIEK